MKEELINLQLTIKEANRIVHVLYEYGTANDVPLIRLIETTIDDATLEDEPEPDDDKE
jgi:hypothetical protein